MENGKLRAEAGSSAQSAVKEIATSAVFRFHLSHFRFNFTSFKNAQLHQKVRTPALLTSHKKKRDAFSRS
jgi:hypothetical protein